MALMSAQFNGASGLKNAFGAALPLGHHSLAMSASTASSESSANGGSRADPLLRNSHGHHSHNHSHSHALHLHHSHHYAHNVVVDDDECVDEELDDGHSSEVQSPDGAAERETDELTVNAATASAGARAYAGGNHAHTHHHRHGHHSHHGHGHAHRHHRHSAGSGTGQHQRLVQSSTPSNSTHSSDDLEQLAYGRDWQIAGAPSGAAQVAGAGAGAGSRRDSQASQQTADSSSGNEHSAGSGASIIRGGGSGSRSNLRYG